MSQKSQSSTILWALYIIWCVALTLLAYGSALKLPFFFDDLAHLPYVDNHTLSEIWRSAGSFPYYRPLQSTVWKVMVGLIDRHDPVVLHGINLLLHALNGILVGWLGGKLWLQKEYFGRRSTSFWLRSFLSASLFILFPFSFQAVPWVGSLAHLLVTTLVLLSLVTFWQMRRTGHLIWGAVSLTFAFMAPFAHENGVLVGPLLAAILFTGPNWRRQMSRNIRYVILWTIPALIWLPIWWLTPKAVDGNVAIRSGETMLQNSAYFVQGFAYPLSWLGGWIRAWSEINDMAVAVGLSVVALAGAVLIQWFSGATRRSLLPWLWTFIAALPALLFLSFDYVINGPRLLMLVSVGAAWLWSDVALQAAGWIDSDESSSQRVNLPRLALVLAVFGALLLQNYIFINNRMKLHELLGNAHQQAISLTTETNNAAKEAIFVNLPAWIAPGTFTFALGHEGVQFLPHYVPPEDLVSVNSRSPGELKVMRVEAIRPEMPYFYGLGSSTGNWQSVAERGGDVFVAEYRPESIGFQLAGTLDPHQAPAEALAIFEDPEGNSQITLASATARGIDGRVEVTLLWHADEPPSEHITAFVHVVDAQGQLLSQMDGDPLNGSYPLSQIVQGTAVADRRVIAVKGDNLTVLVGLYHRLSGERLSAFETSGRQWPDNAVPVMVD